MVLIYMKKHFRIFFAATLLLTLPRLSFGQKDPQFSQFMLNQLFYNPAVSGSGELTRVQLTHRSQYAGYQAAIDGDGGISTQLLTFSMPVRNFGIGFYALNDRIGAYSGQDVQLSLAYKIPVAAGMLSVGGRAGVYRQALDFDRLRPLEPDDPILGSGTVAQMRPDASAGVHYESDKFHLGLSGVHLLHPRYDLGRTEATNPLEPAFYLNAGVNLEVGYLTQVQPVALVKSSLKSINSLSAEGGLLFKYDKKYWLGATYRHEDAFLILMGGVSLLSDQSLHLSGAYDIVAGGRYPKSPASFEIILSKSIPMSGPGKKSIVRTPRFRF